MTNNELAKKLNVSEEQVERMIHTLQYRKNYNKRPEVVERRKLYTATRNERLSQLNKLLKEGE